MMAPVGNQGLIEMGPRQGNPGRHSGPAAMVLQRMIGSFAQPRQRQALKRPASAAD